MTGDLNQAIRQVADMLGVTIDRVAQVIPQYAKMKAATGTVGVAVLLLFAAVAVVLLVVSLRRYGRDPDGFDSEIWLTVAACAGAAAVLLVVVAANVLCDVLSWAFWPDAKVAETVMGMIGK